MYLQRIFNDRANIRWWHIALIFCFVILAFVIGILVCIAPPELPIVVVILPFIAVTFYFKPWVLLPVFILVTMVVPDFKISDLMTFLAFLFLFFRAYIGRQISFQNLTPIKIKLQVFLFVVIVSVLLSVFYFKNPIPFIYRDGRNFLYWFWIPVILILLASKPSLAIKYLVRVFVAIGLMVATAAIVQSVTGLQISGVGRVGDLENTSGIVSGVTRVQMPGFLFVLFSLVWVAVNLKLNKLSWVYALPLFLILGAGLIVNFGRALWFWSAFALALSIVFIDKKHRAGYMIFGVLAVVVAFGGAVFFKPTAVDNILERVSSVKDEGGRGTSYGWRQWENQDAMVKLLASPVVGIGVGGEFRPWLRTLVAFEEHTRYVHNSYLFIALKIGVPGVLVLLLIFFKSWRGVINVLKFAGNKSNENAIIIASVLPAGLGLAITQPELMSSPGVTFFALLISLSILIPICASTVEQEDSAKMKVRT